MLWPVVSIAFWLTDKALRAISKPENVLLMVTSPYFVKQALRLALRTAEMTGGIIGRSLDRLGH